MITIQSAQLVQLPERTHLPVRWTIRDADGNLVTPTSVRYRVDCRTTGIECAPWTSLSPAGPVNFTIPAPANVIRNNANGKERKRLTVEANAGLSNGMTETADYEVINNRFIS